MSSLLLATSLLCFSVGNVKSANILCVFWFPSISHQFVYQSIWKELSLKGHSVTVLTPNPLNDETLTNLTEIDLGFAYDIMRAQNIQNSWSMALPIMEVIKSSVQLTSDITERELKHPEVQALIKNDNLTFDLLLVEFLYPTMYAFSSRFKCPMIGVSSLGVFHVGHDAVGNPTHPVLNPDLLLPFSTDLSFFDRLIVVYYSIWVRYYYWYTILPKEDAIVKKYFNSDMPYLGDIERNVSMLFVSVNPIIHQIRANVPAIVEMMKMHINAKKPLPMDLQIELDNARNGAIYFSLGSNVNSTNLPENIREVLVNVLAELPYTILCKWDSDHLPNKPINVIIRKWLPQQDILGHPNIKAFITQGGLQSMEEAISNHVPMIGMPFFGDQPFNVAKMAKMGIGQKIDLFHSNQEQIKMAIIEVAENASYKNRIKEIDAQVSDQPMTGLQKVMWWTEYILRHKGAKHLRSPALQLNWFNYLLLDVILFSIIAFMCILFISFKIVCLCYKMWTAPLIHKKLKPF